MRAMAAPLFAFQGDLDARSLALLYFTTQRHDQGLDVSNGKISALAAFGFNPNLSGCASVAQLEITDELKIKGFSIFSYKVLKENSELSDTVDSFRDNKK
jgi:hypothetical protein